MPKYAMVIDQARCIGCMACIVACKNENDVPPEHFRTRVIENVSGKYPKLRMELRSELCNHCDHPPCVYNCPTGASYKNKENGMVLLKKNRCVGCPSTRQVPLVCQLMSVLVEEVMLSTIPQYWTFRQ